MSTQFQAAMNYQPPEFADSNIIQQQQPPQFQQQPPPPAPTQQQQHHHPDQQLQLQPPPPPPALPTQPQHAQIIPSPYRSVSAPYGAHHQSPFQAPPPPHHLQAMYHGQPDMEFEDAYMDEQLLAGGASAEMAGAVQGATFSPQTSPYDGQQQHLAMQADLRNAGYYQPAQGGGAAMHEQRPLIAVMTGNSTLMHQQQQLQQQQQQHQQQHQQQPHQQRQDQEQMSPSHKRHHSQSANCILEELETLAKRNAENEEILRRNHNMQEVFVCQLQHGNRIISTRNHYEQELKKNPQQPDMASTFERAEVEFNSYKKLIADQVELLRNTRNELIEKQEMILQRLSLIQRHVLDELRHWNLEQQFSTNNHSNSNANANHTMSHLMMGALGTPVPSPSLTPASSLSPSHQANQALSHNHAHSHSHSHSNNHNMPNQAHLHKLNRIENHIKLILDIATYLRKQVLALYSLIAQLRKVQYDLVPLTSLRIRIDKFLESMILSSFVVEKQPPQVMKTNTRFTSHVRLLGGQKLSSICFSPPHVKVTILSESNARQVIANHQELVREFWKQQEEQMLRNITSAAAPTNGTGVMNGEGAQKASSSRGDDADMLAAQQAVQHHVTAKHGNHRQHHHKQQHHVQQHQAQPAIVGKILDLSQYDSSGEILNNNNLLEYQEANCTVSCQFRNMQLKRIKRTEKKGTESVMDEKFILMFNAEIRLPSNEIDADGNLVQWDQHYHVMAFSLPVVVIVHGNQEPDAWATVTWHNAFARPHQSLYVVPDRVPWRELGQVLSDKFRCCAGKGLSRQNLEYLASKVCRVDASTTTDTKIAQGSPNHHQRQSSTSSQQLMVTWNQFAKEPLPDRSFTFWEWFHSILKLTREHLRDLWCADKIYGFVGKAGCIKMLASEPSSSGDAPAAASSSGPIPVGTFLLRYSETELGGITVAWLSSSIGCPSPGSTSNGTNGVPPSPIYASTNAAGLEVKHLLPFTSKDLVTRSLSDRVRDLQELLYLYPGTPKDEAFEQYYSPVAASATLPNGYIRPMLIQTLVTNYNQKPEDTTEWSSTNLYYAANSS